MDRELPHAGAVRLPVSSTRHDSPSGVTEVLVSAGVNFLRTVGTSISLPKTHMNPAQFIATLKHWCFLTQLPVEPEKKKKRRRGDPTGLPLFPGNSRKELLLGIQPVITDFFGASLAVIGSTVANVQHSHSNHNDNNSDN